MLLLAAVLVQAGAWEDHSSALAPAVVPKKVVADIYMEDVHKRQRIIELWEGEDAATVAQQVHRSVSVYRHR